MATLAGSPVLPLPVEFVAGGEGRPELVVPTLEPGLGGSGRSGRSGIPGGVEENGEPEPRKIADEGRFLPFRCGRVVI